MSGTAYNPLLLFLTATLLAAGDSKTLNNTLESLNLALETTNKSVQNIKQGMESLDSGIQQIARQIPAGSAEQKDYKGDEGLNDVTIKPASDEEQ